MATLRNFLIIDDDSHARFFISRTLLRHYPNAVVQECQDFNTAVELVGNLPTGGHHTVVIAHRTPQAGGKQLVATLRAAHSSVPIIWTGEPDQAHLAQSVGANQFLDSRAWLLIGKVVEELV